MWLGAYTVGPHMYHSTRLESLGTNRVCRAEERGARTQQMLLLVAVWAGLLSVGGAGVTRASGVSHAPLGRLSKNSIPPYLAKREGADPSKRCGFSGGGYRRELELSNAVFLNTDDLLVAE